MSLSTSTGIDSKVIIEFATCTDILPFSLDGCPPTPCVPLFNPKYKKLVCPVPVDGAFPLVVKTLKYL